MTDTSSPRRRSSRSRSRSKGRYSSENRPIRVWCPGSFDFLHFQQINFLRKAKHEMSIRYPKVELVAGLYSDEELISKGNTPVFSLNERYDMLRANKWVDDVVKDAPMKLSKEVLKDYSCDYAFYHHNPEDEEGAGSFQEYDDLRKELMESGLLKMTVAAKDDFPCISSSDLTNRLLLREQRDENNNTASGQTWSEEKLSFPFSISCKELLQFSSRKTPKASDKIVYMDGAFDLLTPDHLKRLEKAHDLGDFLYVGLHSDDSISKYAGPGFPVMRWNERLITLLSCRFVSEVIIDAPTKVTDSLINEFKVDYVVRAADDYDDGTVDASRILDRYAAAKRRGILYELTPDEEQNYCVVKVDKSADDTDSRQVGATTRILRRVHQNWHLYQDLADRTQ